MKTTTAKAFLSLAVVGIFSLGHAQATPADLASTYLWDGGESYAVFTMGTGLGNSSILDNSSVTGDIGVGPNEDSNGNIVAGNQTLNTDSTSALDGNVYLFPGANLTGVQDFTGTNVGPSQPSGAHRAFAGNSSLMTQQEQNLFNGSKTFANMTATPTTASVVSNNNRVFNPATMANLVLSGNTISLTAETSTPVVLKLTSFTMANATLNLVGSSTSSFVFDITSSFAISNHSSINLSGGLTAGNVIFNLIGASPASAGEGTTGYYSVLNSTVTGTIIAPLRTVAILGGSTLNGVAVGERVVIDNSTITQTPASN